MISVTLCDPAVPPLPTSLPAGCSNDLSPEVTFRIDDCIYIASELKLYYLQEQYLPGNVVPSVRGDKSVIPRQFADFLGCLGVTEVAGYEIRNISTAQLRQL